MANPTELLQRYWGHTALRPAQEKAISGLLDHRDVVTLLPTGGGKSICFQIPALLKEGICLVVSPLISLMQDQVENLNKKGLKAIMLAGHIPYDKLNTLLDNCTYGPYKFLYLSPERLQNEWIQERLQHMNINLVAIDEAHCISEWGHDFRPAYREIAICRELLPDSNFIALTATATPRVLKDIVQNLGLKNPEVVKAGFERKNIALLVKKEEDKNHALQVFFKKNPGPAIVYGRTRRVTLQLSRFLNSCQIPAKAYHGGMKNEQKEKLLARWQREDFQVMVATTAFGMGIDKANVRNVVHYHLPDSLENYYQEVGRAGRDGEPAKAFLLYDKADILRLKNQFMANSPTPDSTKLIYKKLNAYFAIPYGEGQEQAYNFNFLDFCNTYGLNTFLVYNVLQFLDRLDVLSLSREFHQRTELYFKISHRELFQYLAEHQSFRKIIDPLLRMQGGFFDYKTAVNLKVLQNKTGLSRKAVNTKLRELEERGIIALTLADQDSTINFLVPREDDRTINPLVPHIDHYYKNKKHKINEVIHFVEDTNQCKVKRLMTYFGEAKSSDCGQCSVCLQKEVETEATADTIALLHQSITEELKREKCDSKQLVAALDFPENKILFVLERMLDRGEIKRVRGNLYSLS